jgi:Lrp/AsnC family transcriptional regulator for asnA, asnC and gidA
MNPEIEIDEIDVKILTMLIRDPRTSLKVIAEKCGLTSVAILKRIKRLKTSGVIIGTTLIPNIQALGYQQFTTIGINLDYAQQPKIIELIQKQADVVELSPSIGKYDLCAVVFTKDIGELNSLIQTIRKHPGIRRIAANIWVLYPQNILENLSLQPAKV